MFFTFSSKRMNIFRPSTTGASFAVSEEDYQRDLKTCIDNGRSYDQEVLNKLDRDEVTLYVLEDNDIEIKASYRLTR